MKRRDKRNLKNSASVGVADFVDTRLVHAECDAIEEDDGHADPLEPRDEPTTLS